MFDHPKSSIKPLEISGLKGRLLEFAAERKADNHRLIILVYGQHASLERVYGIAQYSSQFGRVLVPDLPGFGGMPPFRSVGKSPSLKNYADYLKTFIDQNVGSNQPIQIVGMSFGFWVITKMLQLNPQMSGRCRLVASIVGFVDGRSMKLGFWQRLLYLKITWWVKRPFFACLFSWFFLPSWLLSLVYKYTPAYKHKLAGSTPEQKQLLIDFELGLWRANDTATWASTARQMIVGNLKGQSRIKTRLLHIATENDQYIDPDKNRADLAGVYREVEVVTVPSPAHAPPVIADAQQVSEMLPREFGQRLRQSLK